MTLPIFFSANTNARKCFTCQKRADGSVKQELNKSPWPAESPEGQLNRTKRSLPEGRGEGPRGGGEGTPLKPIPPHFCLVSPFLPLHGRH